MRSIFRPPLPGNRRAALLLSAAACVCLGTAKNGQAAPAYVPGEAVVVFADDRHALQFVREAADDAEVTRDIPLSAAKPHMACIVVRSGKLTAVELVNRLAQQTEVLAVSPNYIRRTFAPTPRDPDFVRQWGFHNTGQAVLGDAGQNDADIDLPEAITLLPRSPPEVVVAVIDTGVDPEHPDLVGRMWHNAGEIQGNGLDDDGNGLVDDVYGYDFAGDGASAPPDSLPLDISAEGHGTHIAGIVAAAINNGLGGVGMGGNVTRIMALKAAYSSTSFRTSDIIAAVNYATLMKARGVNIVAINASFGNNGAYSAPEFLALQAAVNAGIVICAAAGNGGEDAIGDNNDFTPTYPANYPLHGIVSVAASDAFDRLASFSNYGAATVDIAAPGVAIYSTVPRHLATSAQVGVGSTVFTADGMAFAGLSDGIEGQLVNCGFGAVGDFPPNVQGNLALIRRGPSGAALTFMEKASNAMAAGAVGAIVYDNEAGNWSGPLQLPRLWIPVVSVSQSDGQVLAAIAGMLGATRLVNAPIQDAAYKFMQGTSMATPHVAGAVALLAAAFPGDTVTDRVNRILNAVDRRGAMSEFILSNGRLNIANALDSDHDQLPDWWELAATSSLSNMNATTDFDRDNASDRNEFISGTRPDDSLDRLHVLCVARTNAAVWLQWSSATGITYIVQHSTRPDGPFVNISPPLAAVPPLNNFTAPAAADTPAYYRVTVPE